MNEEAQKILSTLKELRGLRNILNEQIVAVEYKIENYEMYLTSHQELLTQEDVSWLNKDEVVSIHWAEKTNHEMFEK